MSRKTLLASIVCGLVVLIAPPASLAAATPSLVGSWQFTLTPTTPPGPVIVIPGLATFTSDGTVVETDATEVIPGPTSTYSTPGHGIWQPGPAVTNLYVQYISVVANPSGSLNAKNTTAMIVNSSPSGTQFKGTYTTTTTDPTGHVQQIITGTVAGQLIPHPTLP